MTERPQIYGCRVYDGNGNLKQSVSRETLIKKHWSNFKKRDHADFTLPNSPQNKNLEPRPVKQFDCTCIVCDKSFKGAMAHANRCSEKCRKIAQNRRDNDARRERRKKKLAHLPEVQCIVCLKFFKRESLKQTFCKDPCDSKDAAKVYKSRYKAKLKLKL